MFILEAANRAAIDAFTESDPYRVNRVWEHVEVHYYPARSGERRRVEARIEHSEIWERWRQGRESGRKVPCGALLPHHRAYSPYTAVSNS